MEEQSSTSNHELKRDTELERGISTWPMSGLSQPDEVPAMAQLLTYDIPEHSDGDSTDVLPDTSSEELDLQISRIQGRWRVFCKGEDEVNVEARTETPSEGHCEPDSAPTVQTMDHQGNDIGDGGMSEPQEEESPTKERSFAGMESQDQGEPLNVDQKGVVDGYLAEEPPPQGACPAEEQKLDLAQSILIFFALVCLLVEILSAPVLTIQSLVGMDKRDESTTEI